MLLVHKNSSNIFLSVREIPQSYRPPRPGPPTSVYNSIRYGTSAHSGQCPCATVTSSGSCLWPYNDVCFL